VLIMRLICLDCLGDETYFIDFHSLLNPNRSEILHKKNGAKYLCCFAKALIFIVKRYKY
jgi:hypothetical protein